MYASAVHRGMTVGDAAVALCAKCLNDHVKQHRWRSVECELLDTSLFIGRFEMQRAEASCKIDQTLVKLVNIGLFSRASKVPPRGFP